MGITQRALRAFSDNWLLYKISRAYVGLVRNVPLVAAALFLVSGCFLQLSLRPRNPFPFSQHKPELVSC